MTTTKNCDDNNSENDRAADNAADRAKAKAKTDDERERLLRLQKQLND